jgi:hypothetical protein
MITEKDKEDSQIKKLEGGIRLCEEAIAKAEKYERLKENKDWQGYLEDLRVLSTLHEKEIKMGTTLIADAPNTGYVKHDASGSESYTSSKSDWVDFICRHEIERTILNTWIKEPDHMVTMASLAREKLPILKKKLDELTKEKSNA